MPIVADLQGLFVWPGFSLKPTDTTYDANPGQTRCSRAWKTASGSTAP
jgi:hypothetical protein